MGQEYELKYRAEASTLEAIRRSYGPFAAIAMETTYYDTPDAALSRRKWTLRQRLENGVSVCTLKTPMADGSRGEWEVLCPEITQAAPLLTAAGAPSALTDLISPGVTPVCGARFTRLAKTIPLEGALVELALDQGFLLGGGRELAFAEVEVELKQGPRQDADRFAAALAREYGLVPEPKSKFKRALSLAHAPER